LINSLIGKNEMGRTPVNARGQNLDMRLLQQFQVIAGQPTLGAAATALAISKPAVSQILVRLEREFGLQLVRRSSTGIELLPAGRRLLELSEELLERQDLLLTEMQRFQEYMFPSCNIYVMESMSNLIISIIHDSMKGKVGEINVDSGRSESCVIEFLRGEIDIIISTESFSNIDSMIDVYSLMEQEFCLAVSAGLGSDVSIHDLAENYFLVRAPKNTRADDLIDAYLNTIGVKPRNEIRCRSLRTTMEIVCSGNGWAIIPPMTVLSSRERLEMVSIRKLPESPPVQTITLAAPRNKYVDIVDDVVPALRILLREQASAFNARSGFQAMNPG